MMPRAGYGLLLKTNTKCRHMIVVGALRLQPAKGNLSAASHEREQLCRRSVRGC